MPAPSLISARTMGTSRPRAVSVAAARRSARRSSWSPRRVGSCSSSSASGAPASAADAFSAVTTGSAGARRLARLGGRVKLPHGAPTGAARVEPRNAARERLGEKARLLVRRGQPPRADRRVVAVAVRDRERVGGELPHAVAAEDENVRHARDAEARGDVVLLENRREPRARCQGGRLAKPRREEAAVGAEARGEQQEEWCFDLECARQRAHAINSVQRRWHGP